MHSNAVTTVLFDATYRWIVYGIDWIVTTTVAVAVLQFAGLTFNPVEGLLHTVRTLLYGFYLGISCKRCI
jgi:hypothetical protein